MPNSKDLVATDSSSILLVGDGGSGKTRFAAGMPKPFFFDFDKGMLSTKGMDVQYETFKDAPWHPASDKKNGKMPGVNEAMGIYEWGHAFPAFTKYLDDVLWPQVEAGTLPYKTLVYDSLTTQASQCMNYVLRLNGKTGKDNPSQPDWGMFLRFMQTVYEQVSAWPIQFVATAHIKRDTNDLMGTTEQLPLVSGQFSAMVNIYFDETYYFYTEKDGVTKLHTKQDALRRTAKSRLNIPSGTPASWDAVKKFYGVT